MPTSQQDESLQSFDKPEEPSVEKNLGASFHDPNLKGPDKDLSKDPIKEIRDIQNAIKKGALQIEEVEQKVVRKKTKTKYKSFFGKLWKTLLLSNPLIHMFRIQN